jgi:DNA-binding CsgD family transcriptional regulator
MVGRARELAEVDAALADVRSGHGRLLLISGPPGIGKSLLAEEAQRRAADLGLTVAAGYAVDDPGAPPLWPWARLLRHWPDARSLLASGAEVDEPDAAARFRLYVAVSDRFRSEADAGGMSLLLEDLHWADLMSVQLLRHMCAELAHQPIGVVVTYRDDVPGPFMDALPELLRGDLARRLVLTELTAEEVGRWLPSLTGSTNPGLAEALHAGTGGNPLLIRLVAEELRSRGGLVGSLEHLMDQRPQLRRLVAAKLAPLTREARDVIDGASVLSERLAPDVLAEMIEMPLEHVRVLIDEALAAGVLSADGPGLQFAHALVRDAAYAELPTQRRVELHARAAVALERLYGDEAAGSIAHHWQGADGPDAITSCGAWARRADDQARAVLAYGDAARFAALAVSCARRRHAADGELAELVIRLAEVLFLAHEISASVDACTEAADLAADAGRTDLLARAALVVHGTGNPGVLRATEALCVRALAVVGADEAATRARLKAQIAVARAELGPSQEAADLSHAALDEARATRDAHAILEALAARHLVISVPHTVLERLELGRQAVALGSEARHPMAALWGHLWRVDAAFQLGNLAEVNRELAEIDWIAHHYGSPVAQWHGHRFAAVGHGLAGRFAEARVANEFARDLAVRLGDRSMLGMDGAFRIQLALVRGSLDDVPDDWADLLAKAPPIPIARLSYPIVHALQGRTDLARAEFDEFRDLPASYPVGVRWAPTMCQLALTANLLDDAEAAATLYPLLQPNARYYSGDGSGGVFSEGSLARLVADMARVAGRHDEAVQHYRDAVAMNSRIGARPFTALSKLGWARSLAARGDLGIAAEHAADAAAEFRRLDMPGPLRAADALIASVQRARRNASPLSAREAEVADLVASALSNREIAERLVLSERTVESHVRSILNKLGFTTRTEIATWAMRQPAGPPGLHS